MHSDKTRLSQRKTSARTVFTTAERCQDLAIFNRADPLAAEAASRTSSSRRATRSAPRRGVLKRLRKECWLNLARG